MFTTNTVNSSQGPDPAPLLKAERDASKFNPVAMNHFLEENRQKAEFIQAVSQQMERDPILANDAKFYDLTKAEQREITVTKINRLARYIEGEDFQQFHRRMSIVNLFDPLLGTRLGVNLGLFLSCVRGNGTAEQVKYWFSDKETSKIKHIYGCFAMTELAHGSNVAGLETTATFDKETDEFIINTPHIGATKWWIGGAAHSSTHTSAYARLIVDGKDYGVKTFVVPLRDSNHDLMPGITVGDIGAKMGRDGIDNGWIQFSSVRIPRFFMLQKFCKVTREGKVTLPPLEQLAYSALLGGRVMMVLDSFRTSARFSTVALRYAIGRRQFKSGSASKGEKLENQIINYPLHQRRVFPYLALAYVISAGAHKLDHTIHDTLDELDAAVEANDMGRIMKSINAMKSLFIDSGSLKSTCTWATAEVIDECRQACGGHGYSAYAGFGKAYNDWVVQCTWEGDNSVLAMSVGKAILKSAYGVVKNGKKAQGSIAFLNNVEEYKSDKPVVTSVEELKDLRKVLQVIEVAIIRVSNQALETLEENKGDFDTVGAQQLVLSKLKAHLYLLKEFVDRVDALEDKSLAPYLLTLGRLYSATLVLARFSGDFLAQGVLTPKVFSEVNAKYIPQLCKEVRPHVVPLTDSFQQSDAIINSAIGNYNGNIYENYFGVVKARNPPSETKAPYSGSVEAMLNRPSVSIREREEKSEQAAAILSK